MKAELPCIDAAAVIKQTKMIERQVRKHSKHILTPILASEPPLHFNFFTAFISK